MEICQSVRSSLRSRLKCFNNQSIDYPEIVNPNNFGDPHQQVNIFDSKQNIHKTFGWIAMMFGHMFIVSSGLIVITSVNMAVDSRFVLWMNQTFKNCRYHCWSLLVNPLIIFLYLSWKFYDLMFCVIHIHYLCLLNCWFYFFSVIVYEVITKQ